MLRLKSLTPTMMCENMGLLLFVYAALFVATFIHEATKNATIWPLSKYRLVRSLQF
jgi:hypothetical protein